MATNNETTDLIVHPNPHSKEYGKEWTTAGTSVFGRFLSALMAEHGKHQRLAIGAELIAFPVLESVVAGLTIMCQKVAAKLGIQLTTETAWQDVANRIHRVVSVGLILEHETVEAAAKAFSSAVVQPVLTGAMIPREQQGLYSFFFNSSGHFFAGCVSATTRLRRELETLYATYQENNLLGSVTLIDEDETSSILTVTGRIDPAEDHQKEVDVEDTLKLAGRLLLYTQQCVAYQRVLRTLPINFRSIPAAAVGHNRSIHPAWVNTQVLLAALEAPAQEGHLQADDYSTAVNILQRLSLEEMVERFWTRMKDRGLKTLDRRDQETLKPLLTEQIKVLRQQTDLATSLEKVFVDLSTARQVHFTHAQAVIYLKDDLGTATGTFAHQPTAHQLMLAVDWRQLTADDIREMLKNFDLPYGVVAQGITLMEEAAQREAVKAFMGKPDQTKSNWSPLFNANIVPVTIELVLQHGALIPATNLEAALPSLLAEAFDVRDDNIPPRLAKELLRLGGKLETAVQKPLVRWHFVRAIMDRALLNPIEIQITAKELRTCFKTGTWEQLTLAAIVMICAPKKMDGGDSYGEKKDRLVAEDFPPWEERFAEGQEVLGWAGCMDFTTEEAHQLVQKYTEEEIFRWLYEKHGSDVDRLWQEYATARDEFHAHWGHKK